jgi:hypothetical protein
MPIQHAREAGDESSGDGLEKREQTRYDLRAVVDFEWMDAEGVPHRGRGQTRDISIKGMFIFSDSQPSTKADIQVEVSLRSVAEAVTNLGMKVEALVIRGELPTSPGIRHGFAVLNRSCKLHNGDPIEN